MCQQKKKAQLAQNHRSIPLDETKRHFVFGDIHGRFATFKALLDLINYDPETDVIYSVGDMIDRGPDSVPVVQFFQQDHCHAVLGNHEQMVLNPGYWEPVWTDTHAGGSQTLASLEMHGFTTQWLTEICNYLPICLDVGDENQTSSFRMIHAECPLSWSEKKLITYLSNESRYEVAEGRLLWGRKDISAITDGLLSGESFRTDGSVNVAQNRSPRAVFCGHTPLDNVVSAFNVHWIDTFAGGVMTCIDPVEGEVFELPILSSDR